MKEIKKVLLINPTFPPSFWGYDNALMFISARTAMMPLALLTVAAMIPEASEIELLDLNVNSRYRNLEKRIRKSDIVLISAMTIQKSSFEEIVSICNRYEKTVVAGGAYVISSHEEIKNVDHLIVGEAELIFPEFWNDWENGVARSVYKVPQSKRSLACYFPQPRYDLIKKLSHYATMSIQCSKGCPHNCEFCGVWVTDGRKMRSKNIAQVIKSLNTLYDLGWKGSVFFVDDNFIGDVEDVRNVKCVKELLISVIKWQKDKRYPFHFFTQVSIGLSLDDELIDLMVKAGFSKVFIGIENPEDKVLLQASKEHNLIPDLLGAVQKIQRKKIQVMAGFIVGLDGETDESFERMLVFIRNAPIVVAMVGLLNALKKTMLYYRLKKENRLTGKSGGDNTSSDLNFEPLLGRRSVLEGYRYILSNLNNPSEFLRRCFDWLKIQNSVKCMRENKTKIEFHHIRSVVMIIWKLLIFSSHRSVYKKFMLDVRGEFKSWSVLIQALEWMVMCHHFCMHTRHTLVDIDKAIKALEPN